MRKGLIISSLLLFTLSAIGVDIDWATRIPCEMQGADIATLQPLKLLQGTTPLISADQYRSGRALTADSNVVCTFVIKTSLSNQWGVVSTNYATSGNGYLIQLPSIGTNAVNWTYTLLYYRNGQSYWTGSGRLDIRAGTVTGDALVWQYVGASLSTNDINTSIATHNSATASGMEISARYDAEHRQDFLNQTASVKLRWAF